MSVKTIGLKRERVVVHLPACVRNQLLSSPMFGNLQDRPLSHKKSMLGLSMSFRAQWMMMVQLQDLFKKSDLLVN